MGGGRGVHEKPIYRGDYLKREAGRYEDLRVGGLAKKRGWFFRGVADILMHTMLVGPYYVGPKWRYFSCYGIKRVGVMYLSMTVWLHTFEK